MRRENRSREGERERESAQNDSTNSHGRCLTSGSAPSRRTHARSSEAEKKRT